MPFGGGAYGEGIPGCHSVMALVNGGTSAGELVFSTHALILKNVMLTLVLGDEHIACLAMSALFPLITKSDPSLRESMSEPL